MNYNDYSKPQCSVCNDVGTIQTFKWVEVENYPIPYQYADVQLCECQKEKIFDKYNASAGMKPHERMRTFDNSSIDQENKAAFEQCQRFVENIDKHLENGMLLYIYGDEERAKKKGAFAYGTGKSHLTHCIGNMLTEMKKKAIYTTEDKLFEEIKNTYSRDAEETESEVLWRYESVPVLLIDDLFKSKTTDWTQDKIFHLLNNRLGTGKVTIINSNYAPTRIHETTPKNGSAIASRILGEAVLIEMIGRDRRKDKAIERFRDNGTWRDHE